MITWVLIWSAVIGLVLVVLLQGKWTSRDSWFVAAFVSMAMAIDHYVSDYSSLGDPGWEATMLRLPQMDDVCVD